MGKIESLEKVNVHQIISINDLKDKYFSGYPMRKEESEALAIFDTYRITQLNKQESEEAFHKEYLRLQIISNLTNYTEFLKEEYKC